MTVDEVRFATSNDEELRTLITAIQTNKWSDPIVGIYKKISHEISVHDGLILRGNRIIIPKSLREKVINLAHAGHQGVVKTKAPISLAWRLVGDLLATRVSVGRGDVAATSPGGFAGREGVAVKSNMFDFFCDSLETFSSLQLVSETSRRRRGD